MEGLRGYGVLAILVAHVSTEFLGKNRLRMTWVQWRLVDAPTYFDLFLVWTAKTHYCVDLFFIVSGFLIFRILVRDRENFSYTKFMWNRMTRVYPAFACSVAIAIWVRTQYIPNDLTIDSGAIIKNLLFLNGAGHPGWAWLPVWERFANYNPVTWTLLFEFIFYLFIPVVLIIPRLRITESKIHYLLFAAVLFLAIYPIQTASGGQYHIRWLFFLAGGFAGLFKTSELRALTARVPDWATLSLYLASTLYYAFTPYDYRVFAPIYMVTGTLFMVSVGYGSGFLGRVFSYPLLRYVGNCSYSLYLVHLMCIRTCMQFFRNIEPWPNGISGPGFWPWLALLASSFVLALLLATLLFVFVEKRYFLAKVRAKSAPPAGGSSAPT